MLLLRTLGGLSLENDGNPLAGVAGQRGRLAILAVISAAGDAGVSRDRLHAMFWPESDEERARGALKQALYALRRDLKEDLTQGTSTLRLNREVVRCDAQEFEGALATGNLEDAVARFVGPFLDGIHLRDAPEFERWAEIERERLTHLFRDALERLARSATQRQDRAGAVQWWRKRAASEPLSARVACEYMSALAAAGDREAATQHARVYSQFVAAELETEPDPSVMELAESLRARREAATVVGAPQLPAPVGEAARANDLAERARAHAAGIARGRVTGAQYAGIALSLGLIGFVALRNPADRYTIDTTERITATPALEVDASLSPDGKLLAYASGPMNSMRVMVRQLAGGREIALTGDVPGDAIRDQRSPQWSPDGTRILFQSRGVIYVVPSLGGTATRMAGEQGHMASTPSWSPDGKWIAFADDRGIWIRSVDNGTPELVTPGGFQTHSPRWSPDGSRIGYVVGNAYYVYGNIGPSVVWIVSVQGGAPTRVSDTLHLNTYPIFSADGRSVLYVSNRDGPRDVFQQQLRDGIEPSGDPVRLTTGSNVFSIDLTRDGSRLVYSVYTARSNIWSAPITERGTSMDSATTQVTLDNANVETISLSKDTKWLLFDSNKSGNADIYKMPVEGGEPVQLTHDRADDFGGVMSPDNQEVAYFSFRDGRRHLRVMAADGTNDHPITEFTGHEWSPQWSPDGKRLFFVSIESGRREVYMIARTPDGGWSAARKLTNLPDGSSGAKLSADGRTVAWPRDSGITLVDVESGAHRVAIDGRKAGFDPSSAWGADPSTLFYLAADRDGRMGFWRVPVAGGTPQLVLSLRDRSRATRRPEFATDGRRIYFTIANDDADVWMAKLKR